MISNAMAKAIARAVRARDNNTCTFPGCRNRRFLNEWVFVRPDGIEVPKYGYRPEDMIEEGRFEPGDETYPPEINSTRVELLSTLEKIVREPPPPVYWH